MIRICEGEADEHDDQHDDQDGGLSASLALLVTRPSAEAKTLALQVVVI
jgi:hypothetical protein